MNSLFIGRFQPFHHGHLQDIKDIISNNEKVLIVLGSAQKSRQSDYPLNVEERTHLIKETLSAEGIKPKQYSITSLEDIEDDEKWVQHCANSLPPFNKVYTGSDHVSRLFTTDGQFPIVPVNFVNGITATIIRDLIRQDDPSWKKLVPKKTAELLIDQKLTAIIKST